MIVSICPLKVVSIIVITLLLKLMLYCVDKMTCLTRPTNWSTKLKIYLDIRTGSQMKYIFSRNILIYQDFFILGTN